MPWAKLKNLIPRFPVYALLPELPTDFRQRLRVWRLKTRRMGIAYRAVPVVMGLLIGGGVVTLLFPSLSPIRIPQRHVSNLRKAGLK